MKRFVASNPQTRKMIESGEITYVGREFAGLEASPLGNPFKAKKDKSDLGEVILKYRKWLLKKIREDDPDVLRALLEVHLSRKVACWCPLDRSCHGDVVLRAAQWYFGGNNETQ